MKTEIIRYRTTKKEKEKLRKFCVEHGTTFSELIRMAIEQLLTE